MRVYDGFVGGPSVWGIGFNVLTLPVYLDNHATTRTDPRVLEAMLPYFTTVYGNAASVSHRFGWDAGAAIDRAREQVAELIGADPREIVFTSGATEANNLALKGALPPLKRRGDHLITAATERKYSLDNLGMPIRPLSTFVVPAAPVAAFGSGFLPGSVCSTNFGSCGGTRVSLGNWYTRLTAVDVGRRASDEANTQTGDNVN